MSSRSSEDETERKYDELCLDLNLDVNTKNEAWASLQKTADMFTLEGDTMHWLACAVYTACRKTSLQTVGQGTMEGNCVSLTRLLRSTKLSLIEFFKKIKKWADMVNLPQEFREKIERLERNFNVSTVIFKKFTPIWLDVFNDPANDPPKPPRSRKQRRLPCSVSETFNFCWTTFIQVKGHFPAISDDLVNSYHLLLCCVDWVYANALSSHRTDLLNPNCSQLPDNFGSADWQLSGEPPCVMDWLSESHDGLVLEAKGIKEHWWKPYLRKHFSKRVLRGDADKLLGVLDTSFFENNSKAIDRLYEEYVLNVGDFDERVFLGDSADEEIGTPAKSAPNLGGEMKKRMQEHLKEVKTLAPNTPYTNRRYLPEKGGHMTPVSTATKTVSRLQQILFGRKSCPSDKLLSFFEACSHNPKDEVLARVKSEGQLFTKRFSQDLVEPEAVQCEMSARRLHLAECLYYKVLENIMVQEASRNQPNNGAAMDFSTLLSQDIFHRSLFSCCLEIILFSYNSQRTFPWILDAMGLQPYSFYKVIELLIRAEEALSRDIYKHLNYIEESILESLAWRWDSLLWDTIVDTSVPSVEDVSYPNQIEYDDGVERGLMSPTTAPLHPDIRRIMAGSDAGLQSQASLAERFSSPAPGLANAKRRLFSAVSETNRGQGQKIFLQQLTPSHSKVVAPSVNVSSQCNKPRRTGSLALFFRKVYHLASVRLRDLAERLDIDSELRSQIWTCFEQTLVLHVDLMKDRHIDQLLMCAIYIISKVTGKDRQFQDIMKCYRLQPQSRSHVYRSVLVTPSPHKARHGSGGSSDSTGRSTSPSAYDKRRSERLATVRSTSALPSPADPESHPGSPTPQPTAAQEALREDEAAEERGDLIHFYNAVFVKRLREFANKFSRNHRDKAPLLSPMPISRSHPLSPRRVSDKHSVYVSPHKHSVGEVSPNMKMLYCFNRSPAKDLRAINSMLKLNSQNPTHLRVQAITFTSSGGLMSDASGPPAAKRLCTSSSQMLRSKLDEIAQDRQANINGQH